MPCLLTETTRPHLYFAALQRWLAVTAVYVDRSGIVTFLGFLPLSQHVFPLLQCQVREFRRVYDAESHYVVRIHSQGM